MQSHLPAYFSIEVDRKLKLVFAGILPLKRLNAFTLKMLIARCAKRELKKSDKNTYWLKISAIIMDYFKNLWQQRY